MDKPCISIIAALGKNRELGLRGELLWRIPEDLQRFKRLTLHHPVIMGRKTFESIGKPLPGRPNIILTRDPHWRESGVIKVHSLAEALGEAEKLDGEEVFIIGGAQLYEQALPLSKRLYLTLIEDSKEADTYFPAYEHLFIKKISEEIREHDGLQYRFLTLEN